MTILIPSLVYSTQIKKDLAALKLDRNFKDIEIAGSIAKRAIHGKAYGFALPAPDFRAECRDHENLPIEFMFRDKDLNREVNNVKLGMKRKVASTKLGEKKIQIQLDDLTHFKDVSSNKAEFAEKIVPTFDEDSFSAFEAVFAIVDGIIADDANRQLQ